MRNNIKYRYKSNVTGEEKEFKTITDICRYTGIKRDNLYYHFIRLGRYFVENEKYEIEKIEE